MEFIHTQSMGSLSGLTDNYEDRCQLMLNAGVHWLIENPEWNRKEDSLGQVLWNVGCDTELMHGTVVSCLQEIHKYGWNSYVEATVQDLRNRKVRILRNEPSHDFHYPPTDEIYLISTNYKRTNSTRNTHKMYWTIRPGEEPADELLWILESFVEDYADKNSWKENGWSFHVSSINELSPEEIAGIRYGYKIKPELRSSIHFPLGTVIAL